jgi:uncharacterized damage-inducible protein DinB
MEAGGYYGVGKLLRALAFSEEVKAAQAAGIPRGAALLAEFQQIIDALRASGADATILTALERSLQVVQADSTVPYDVIPAVHVSRTSGEVFLGEPPVLTPDYDYQLGLRAFLPVWYFESLTPQACLEALQSNPAVFEARIADLTPDQFFIAPAAGEWNMQQLLWHLLQAQELLEVRVQLILTQSHPALDAAAVWTNQDAGMLSVSELWERYRASRESLVHQLQNIAAADWWRSAWHSEFGPQTLLSQCTYFARHEMSHMPQFGQIRRGIGKP